jgi:hypothetical protein
MSASIVWFLSGSVGAVIIGFLLNALLNWRKEKYSVEIAKEIVDIKRQFLDDLKQSIKDAQEAVTTVRITQEQAAEEAKKISLRREQAEVIVEKLEGKTEINSEAVASILKSEIEGKLLTDLNNISASILRLDTGQVTFNGPLRGKGVGKLERVEKATSIRFQPGVFREEPKVCVILTRIDLGDKGIHRLEVEAEEVTKDGFNLVFKTWLDSVVYTACATWLAIGK